MSENPSSNEPLDLNSTVPATLELDLVPGGKQSFGALRGQWIVLYFYPKDATPGCTTEANDFNANLDRFADSGARVIGVSRDSISSHEKFRAKQGLNFALASDSDETLCQVFDVIHMKNMYGKQVRGIERSTFLIDPDGVIRHVWRKVKVPEHVDRVLVQLGEYREQAG
ncbi:MAG: peroxiredoxin [Thioalkalivibrionaceae bacterium]